MIGILLVAISSLFGEISASLGKEEVGEKKESIYTMGFLSLFWGTLWFLGFIIFKQKFVFSAASLPTFLIRAALEIAVAHLGVLAVIKAERSTFSFVRISTIILLLLVDLFLGYPISIYQMAGIVLISLTLLISFLNHGVDKKGLGFVLAVAILAVPTVSLYKYNISHFNSVEAEQFLIHLMLLFYFFVMAMKLKKENPAKFLAKPLFLGQSFSSGLGSVLGSFAYSFAPASIIIAGERSASILFSLVSGKIYFHEKHIVFKLIIFALVAGGIILLIN